MSDEYYDELLTAVMRAVNSISLIDLPNWLEVCRSDKDPRKLPGYHWLNYLFTDTTKAGFPKMDAYTKYVFKEFADAKLASGEDHPNNS